MLVISRVSLSLLALLTERDFVWCSDWRLMIWNAKNNMSAETQVPSRWYSPVSLTGRLVSNDSFLSQLMKGLCLMLTEVKIYFAVVAANWLQSGSIMLWRSSKSLQAISQSGQMKSTVSHREDISFWFWFDLSFQHQCPWPEWIFAETRLSSSVI